MSIVRPPINNSFSCKLIRLRLPHTRAISAEQIFTRDHWRKQVLPVCGDVLKVFVHACQAKMARVNKNFENVDAHGGNLLTPMVTIELLLSR